MIKKDLNNLFTSFEEYNAKVLDQYERVLYHSSTNRSPRIPHVSNYLYENGFKPSYPDGKSLAVCISHDIDVLYNYDKTTYIRDLLKRSDNVSIKYLLSRPFAKSHYPPWKIENLLDIHSLYGIKSSYYFLSLSPEDWDFNFNVAEESSILKKIVFEGNEIGLHGGHDAFNNLSAILKQKNQLELAIEKKVTGYRNHYLRFRTPLTWNLLVESGFKYDTTFGYADCVGFRNGMCYPFQPYDIQKKEFLNILEIPLIAMDCSFFESYMRLSPQRALDLIDEILDKIEAVNGVFTLLWHNSYLDKPYSGFYESVLKKISLRNPWYCTGESLTKWWIENNFNEAINDTLIKDIL